jgi:hypothetical protein
MGRALILVESLAAALLLVALAAAWAARRPRGLRWGVPVVVVATVAAPAAILAYGLNYLHKMGTVSLTSVVAATAWTSAFLIGSFIIILAARRAGAEPAPTARPWPVGSLAVAFAVAVVLTAVTVSNLDVAVKSQIAAVRVEAGAKALALAPPRLPDARNAAPLYRRAFAALTPQDQLPALLRDRAQVWQGYDRAAFDPSDREQREFLESQQRGLALLREAAAVPYCSFDRDWFSDTSPIDLPVPELPRLRHGALLLAYDALARASRGDSRGALDDVSAIFGIARHVHYPLLIDLVTAAAVEKTGARVLEDVLSLAPAKAEDLARLNVGAGEPFRERLRRVFVMEEAWGLAAFVMIATGRARGSPDIQAQTPMDAFGEAMLDSPLYRIFFLEDDLATYRRHLRTTRENAAQPAPAMLEGFNKHEQSIRATRGGGILAGLLIPATVKCAYLSLDADATRSLVRLAIAATAYKAKHRKYPEKLTDLVPDFVPEVPPDPYDGRPMRLRHEKGGIVIYSIGRDRKGEGRTGDEKKQEDLAFYLR